MPYALGMLLDDLAQPMNYDSNSRRHVVDLLMDALRARIVNPKSTAYLLKYPPSIERLINLARADDIQNTLKDASHVLTEVIGELNSNSILGMVG